MAACAQDLHKPCYDAARLLDNLPWLGELVDAMQELGWGVYSFDHEDAVGQFEVDFDFCEAGESSDRFVLLRMMSCAIARKHGCYASWMPKPMESRTGSGAYADLGRSNPRRADARLICYSHTFGPHRHLNVSLHDFDSEKWPPPPPFLHDHRIAPLCHHPYRHLHHHRNLFKRDDGQPGLSELGQHFLGGAQPHPGTLAAARPMLSLCGVRQA